MNKERILILRDDEMAQRPPLYVVPIGVQQLDGSQVQVFRRQCHRTREESRGRDREESWGHGALLLGNLAGR